MPTLNSKTFREMNILRDREWWERIREGKEKRVQENREGGGVEKKSSRQEKWSVTETTALGVYAHKDVSIRDLSSKNLRTDRQVSFQNAIKTLCSKIHNHTTSFVTCCSLNAYIYIYIYMYYLVQLNRSWE